MPALAKALIAKCPKCGSPSIQKVDSYKQALHASEVRSFDCKQCDTEYFARKIEITCGVLINDQTVEPLSA